jgi:hypothetical protein
MKRANVFTIIFILFLIASCSQQDSKWKGSIRTEDGVTIVENPIEPMYTGEVLELEEDLIIGKNVDEEDFLFQRISAVKADNEGNIYVLDDKASKIMKFDPHGNLIAEFGRKGQGPGEFNFALGMQLSPKGELMVSDTSSFRFVFFNLQGEYLTHLTAMFSDTNPHLDSRGNIIFQSSAPGNPWVLKLAKYDRNGDLIQTICNLEYNRDLNEMEVYSPNYIYYTVLENDHVVWAVAKPYELSVVDDSGRLIKKIRKKYIPIKVTQEDIDMFKDHYKDSGMKVIIPEHYPPIRGISSDDEERIFVNRYATDPENRHYDVFDPEGKFISTLVVKNHLTFWKDKKLYCVAEDPDGYQYIIRYKVTWNY